MPTEILSLDLVELEQTFSMAPAKGPATKTSPSRKPQAITFLDISELKLFQLSSSNADFAFSSHSSTLEQHRHPPRQTQASHSQDFSGDPGLR